MFCALREINLSKLEAMYVIRWNLCNGGTWSEKLENHCYTKIKYEGVNLLLLSDLAEDL